MSQDYKSSKETNGTLLIRCDGGALSEWRLSKLLNELKKDVKYRNKIFYHEVKEIFKITVSGGEEVTNNLANRLRSTKGIVKIEAKYGSSITLY